MQTKDMRRKSSFHTPIAPILIVRKVMRRHQQNTEWTITVHRNRHYDIVTFASYLVFHRQSLTKGYVRFLFYHVGRIQSGCYPFGIFPGFDRLHSDVVDVCFTYRTKDRLVKRWRAKIARLHNNCRTIEAIFSWPAEDVARFFAVQAFTPCRLLLTALRF